MSMGHYAPPAGHVIASKCPFLVAEQRGNGFVKEASMELREDVQRTESPCEGKQSTSVGFDLGELTGSMSMKSLRSLTFCYIELHCKQLNDLIHWNELLKSLRLSPNVSLSVILENKYKLCNG